MSLYRYLPVAGILLAVSAWAAPLDKHVQEVRPQPAGGQEQHLARGLKHHPTELLVKYRRNVGSAQAEAAARASGAVAVRGFKKPRRLQASAIDQWRVVKAGRGADLEKLRAALLKNPNVERVEFNFEVRLNLAPNDPSYGSLWGLHNSGQTGGLADADIDAPEAWDLGTGDANTVVAVIDTGIARNHPDLAANIWTNSGEIPGNGLDDDGNGYVDDVYGYDFFNNDADPYDDHGHGTHVSGTIAATGNNGTGVVGVSWNARVMGLKFLGADGSGYTTGAIGAILYAADMGAQVMNNSWGGGGFAQALLDAILTADQAGALFVAAAGNAGSNNDAAPNYPSNYDAPNVLAVAATNSLDGKASFSNYGATTVDLGAPGEGIYSTVPTVGSSCCSSTSGYLSLSGTSMATPHVSGAAALILSRFPGISHHQVKDRLMGTGDQVPSLAGITVTGRRLNVANALENDTVPPAMVTDLLVAGTSAFTVNLSWTATGDDDFVGSASSYQLRYATHPLDPNNFDSGTLASGLPKPALPGAVETVTVSGLAPNTTYYFALKVVDNGGNASLLSNPVSATTASVSLVFSDDLEAGGGNWTVSGSDGVGGPALWHLSTHRSGSPTTAFYYGKESTLNYDTGAANQGAIVSGPISLQGAKGARLSFNSFLQTENFAPYDAARVAVSADGGVSWTDIYVTSLGTGGQMAKVDLDLSAYENQQIRLRFSFDTYDPVANGYEGWVVDDVQIFATLEGDFTPPAPVMDLQAASIGASYLNLAWTATADDAYSGGPATSYDLRYATFPIDASNFDAAIPVTGVPVPGPSGTVESYKLGALTSGTTYFVALRVIDNVGNKSELSNVLVVGTKQAVFGSVFYDDLEGAAGNWSFAGSNGLGGPALWHVSPHRSSSPSNALYYGQESTLNFNTGARNYGTATSYPINLADVDGARLTFRHFLQTENLAPYDAARVQASTDAGVTWNDLYVTSVGTNGQMVAVDLDLAAYEGQAIQLRFSFDTVDSAYNGYEGWVVDDVAITGWSPASQNMPPQAKAGGPYTGLPGQSIFFDGSASFDPEGQPLTYEWNFGDGTTGVGPLATHVYNTKGSYTATLTVSDGVTSSTATSSVLISNRDPVATAGGPYTVHRSVPLVLDASGSYDPDGDTLTYTWNFGDGSSGSGVKPIHTYTKQGSYSVSLQLTDGEATSFVVTTVTVTNLAPTANAGGPYTVQKNKGLQLSGAASADPDGDALTYQWSFDDGTTATGATQSRVYSKSGLYGVTLVVSDGELSAQAQTTVTVTNTAPVASAGGPYAVEKNKVLQLSAAASADADGDALTYQWDFGDGSTGSGVAPTHVYAKGGAYTVTLVVSDGESTTQVQTTVAVSNQAPVASFTGPAQVFKNDLASFDAAASSDADGDPLKYKWNFGGGFLPPSDAPLGSATFPAVGTYTVQLLVSDGEVDSLPVTRQLSVISRPPVADAGADQTVQARSAVALNGSASSDPDGTITGYLWHQVAGPAVTLAGAQSAFPSFTAPNIAGTASVTLVFALAVTDSDGVTASDQVTVTIVKKL